MKKYLVLFVIVALASCSKDDDFNTEPSMVSVTVSFDDFSAILNWTDAVDPNNDSIIYSVILENIMISEGNSETSIIIENLEVNTSYSGIIIADDGKNGVSETSFSFTTGQAIKTTGGSGDDYGKIILELDNGNYLIGSNSSSNDGFIASNFGFSDIVVSMHDRYGNLIWAENFGTRATDGVNDLIKTNDNNYLLLGSRGKAIKFDPTGNVIWEITLREDPSNSESNEFRLRAVVEIGDGYIFVGSITVGGINNQAVIVKTDSSGNQLWDKRYDGSGSDIFTDVILHSEGSLFITGESESTDGDFSTNYGEVDIVFGEFDQNGDKIFVKNIGGTDYDRAYKITEVNGKIYIGGESWSSDIDFSNHNGFIDSFVGEVDIDGNVVWLKNHGTPLFNSFIDFFVKDTEIYLSLSGDNDDAWILKLDNSGNQTDEIIYSGNDTTTIASMTNFEDGTMAAVGYSNSTDVTDQSNLGGYDILFIKF